MHMRQIAACELIDTKLQSKLSLPYDKMMDPIKIRLTETWG